MSSKKEIKKLQRITDGILARKEEMVALTDAQLQEKTEEFRRRLAAGESEDALLEEAFAVAREAGRRVLGMEHFPVQIMGGIVLHQGRIAQMRTGEGKTLVATLPAYLNALSGKGVHVVTTNDYLAKRDCEEMGRLYRFLGLRVGAVLAAMSPQERKEAYACDITYITNSEVGFDYLRDNMVTDAAALVQRGLNYAIIDEVDSVLIDDARTPLIISGVSPRPTKLYEACDSLARRMVQGEKLKEYSKLDSISGIMQEESGDFAIDDKEQRVLLTEAGVRRVERFFRVENVAEGKNLPILHHMNLALRANYLMERDKDYVVQNDEVFIVDAMTGRIMQGRRFSDGLHQAIEAKERVRIRKENRSSATVTYQCFFNKYRRKAGMTGTGKTEEGEFAEIYGMDIVEIPTNRPVLRIDQEDTVFRTRDEKFEAVCRDVQECRKDHRPILIGTISIADSEELSHRLDALGIHHNVLNAKYHQQEAAIVAKAGRRGAVTIATNMAGRGTDIKLDEQARKAGGLLVIGTERGTSRRSDDQLCGRSGRQGDPGESRFYLSLDDGLLKLYGKKQLTDLYDKLCPQMGAGVTDPALSKAAAYAQKCVEADHFAARKQVMDYDFVLNHHREVLYAHRRKALLSDDIHGILTTMISQTAADIVESVTGLPAADRTPAAVEAAAPMLSQGARDRCLQCSEATRKETLTQALLDRYEAIENAFGDKAYLHARERLLLLKVVDEQWVEHIEEMGQLRDGIGLVSYAQKDPVIAYQKAAFELFEQMNHQIRFLTTESLLRIPEMPPRK